METAAEAFVRELEGLGPGVRMGDLFALAKAHRAMEPAEIRTLLRDPAHTVRVGAVSIMDFQARDPKTTKQRRQELYELYLGNHDRIDTWDLVDRAAPYVVGGYLSDKSRQPLYDLARSSQPMERRTAIVATYYFIRQHDLDDTFRIGAILAHDPNQLVQRAVGGWVREAGKQDLVRLREYLDTFAATMPRTALRYAVEHLDAGERSKYLAMKRGRRSRVCAGPAGAWPTRPDGAAPPRIPTRPASPDRRCSCGRSSGFPCRTSGSASGPRSRPRTGSRARAQRRAADGAA